MILDTTKLSHYFRYGFIDGMQISLEMHPVLSETKEDIFSILSERFYTAARDIQSLSLETGRSIFLWLSAGIDSLLIYKTFQELSIDFTAINLSYGKMYSEADQIKKILWDSEKNITFLHSKTQERFSQEIDYTWLLFPHTVSHPTLLAYGDILEHVPQKSIFVTWDLWDEIFGNTESAIIAGEALPEYVFSREELEQVFPWVFFQDDDIQVDNDAYMTEIYLLFTRVTQSMWENIANKKDINYIPFYKYFLPFLGTIKQHSIQSDTKEFLLFQWEKMWISPSHLLSSGIKFPVDDEINNDIFQALCSRKHFFEKFGIYINENFLTSLFSQPSKKLKWKLFSLYVFTFYLEYNDHRFLKSR